MINNSDYLYLSDTDRDLYVESILNPPEPNDALKAAGENYKHKYCIPNETTLAALEETENPDSLETLEGNFFSVICDEPVGATEILVEDYMKPMNMGIIKLAAKIDVEILYLSSIFSGESVFTLEILEKICAVVGGSPAVLMRLETEFREWESLKNA